MQITIGDTNFFNLTIKLMLKTNLFKRLYVTLFCPVLRLCEQCNIRLLQQ